LNVTQNTVKQPNIKPYQRQLEPHNISLPTSACVIGNGGVRSLTDSRTSQKRS